MNTLPVREVFISPCSRRLFHNREHENLIFLPTFWEAYWCSPEDCLQGSYPVRAAGMPKGSCICKWVGWLRAEIRAGKFEKMVAGSMYWKVEQSREKYGWREMGIRWLARERLQQSTEEKFSESTEERKNLAQCWLTSGFFYTIQCILPKQNILSRLTHLCQPWWRKGK